MQRKYLALTISIILCLGATLFFLKPTTSQTIGQYDPWLDSNEDGYVNAKDAIVLGGAFGTTGDPTRNVNVTNWPTESPYRFETLSLNLSYTILVNGSDLYYYYYGTSVSPPIYIGGYSRMWIYLMPPNPNSTTDYAIVNYNVTHVLTRIDWSNDQTLNFAANEKLSPPLFLTSCSLDNHMSPALYDYDSPVQSDPIQVKMPYIRLYFYSQSWLQGSLTGFDPGWMNMTVKIYLRNE